MLILMLILGISMPANAVEVKDTSQNIYNVVQNSDGTYTITVKGSISEPDHIRRIFPDGIQSRSRRW